MLTTLLLTAHLVSAPAAVSCESLQTLALPDTTILSVTLVPAGPFTPSSLPGAPAGQPARPITAMLEGPGCGLCIDPQWTIQKKNMR